MIADEIARSLGNFKIIYGARAPPGTTSATAYTPISGDQVDFHVGVIKESEGYGHRAEEGWRLGATFPDGRYDGNGYPDTEKTRKKKRRLRVVLEECSDNESEDENDEKARLLRQTDV